MNIFYTANFTLLWIACFLSARAYLSMSEMIKDLLKEISELSESLYNTEMEIAEIDMREQRNSRLMLPMQMKIDELEKQLTAKSSSPNASSCCRSRNH